MLNLIDKLPPNTHYRAALMLDPEYIREVMEFASEQGEEYTPPGELYSPEVEAMNTVADEIRLLRAEAISMQGGNPGKPKFSPRPKTAMKQIEDEASRSTYDWLHEQLIGARDRAPSEG